MTVMPRAQHEARLSNQLLGATFFLLSEAVFFLGLVFVALQVRRSFASWPPVGADAFAPLLSVDGEPLIVGSHLIVFNTGLLIAAAIATALAVYATRRDRTLVLQGSLVAAGLLGTAFLAAQAFEFARLGGWLAGAGDFRMLFDVVALLHGLHVAGGLGLLLVVWWRARLGHVTADSHGLVQVAEWYWLFVTGAWLALLLVLTVV